MSTMLGKAGGELAMAAQREKVSQVFSGKKRFAWLPTRIYTGGYIWLQFYWSYHSGDLNHDQSRIRLIPNSDARAFGDNAFLNQDPHNVDCYHKDVRMSMAEIRSFLSQSPLAHDCK